MAIEYLLVHFGEDRDVLADGDRVGVTNHTVMIQPGEYIIKMSGSGYAPASQDVVVVGTSVMRPKVVTFTALAGADPPDKPLAARRGGGAGGPGSLSGTA
jgi:hypothetical protein